MSNKKCLGIWMDHANAHLIDIAADKRTTISSDFTYDVKEETLSRSEHIMHNKRQQMQEGYYKQIGEAIRNYNQVLLFGPTNAKVELQNYVGKDVHFKEITIDVASADKMTENEQHAFVRKHFEADN